MCLEVENQKKLWVTGYTKLISDSAINAIATSKSEIKSHDDFITTRQPEF
jgi:hypothetical protein